MTDFDEAFMKQVTCEYVRCLHIGDEMRRDNMVASRMNISREELREIITEAKITELWDECLRKVSLEKKGRK